MFSRLIVHIKRPRKYRAQGLVEFALILPVLLLTVFVIVELARVLFAWMAVENGARFGVRYAVTGEFDGDAYCGGSCADEAAEEAARIPSIKDAARAGAVALLRNDTVTDINLPGFFDVNVCSNHDGVDYRVDYTPGDPNVPSASTCTRVAPPLPDVELDHAGEPGETVIVTVEFTHPLITPMLSTVWPDMHLRAQRTGIVEQYRTSRVFGLPLSAFTTPPTPTSTFTPVPTSTPTSTNTPVPTPTPSNTPTPTRTPNCGDVDRLYDRLRDDDYEVRFRNDNPGPVYLSWSYLTDWPKLTGSMKADKFRFDGDTYWRPRDDNAPTGPRSSWEEFKGNGNRDWWEVDFSSAPLPLWGYYRVELRFDWPGNTGSTCNFTESLNQSVLPTNTPRATRTPGPSRTPRPTNTSGPPPPATPTNTSGPPPPATATDTDVPDATATIDWGDG